MRSRTTHLLVGVTLLLGSALFTGCSSTSQSAASSDLLEPGILSACLYPGFAPFTSKSGDALVGWDVDYLRGFADEHDLEFRPVEVADFNGIWLRPGRGECDVAGTGISITPDRTEQLGSDASWSDSYYSVARSFAVRAGADLTRIEDLAGRTVIVTKGSTADIDLTNRLAAAGITDTKVTYVTDEAEGAKQVASAGPDGPFAYGGGAGSVETLTKQLPGLEMAWVHCLMEADGSISSEPFGFAVRSASTGLLGELNSYIADPANGYPGGVGSGTDCPTGP
jgi:ABC-type amino acid transport substrate-binding protein